MPELRRDPVVGRWVIISTERARRPSDFPARLPRPRTGPCVLCEGQEDKTPPELWAVRAQFFNAARPAPTGGSSASSGEGAR